MAIDVATHETAHEGAPAEAEASTKAGRDLVRAAMRVAAVIVAGVAAGWLGHRLHPFSPVSSLLLSVLIFGFLAPFAVLDVRNTLRCRVASWVEPVVGCVMGLAAMGAVVALGQANDRSGALFAALFVILGFGLVLIPTDSVWFPCIPAVGTSATMLVATVIGEIWGSSSGTLWLIPATLVALTGASAVVRMRVRPEPRTVEVGGRSLAVGAIVIAALGLGLWLTILPYMAFKPAVPFGRDMQHERNVESIIRTGHAAPRSAEVTEFYPDTYGYWAASPAIAAGASTLATLKVLPAVTWLLAALSVFLMGWSLFGLRAGLASCIAFSVWCYQPRHTLVDGAFIGVAGEYFLGPVALYAFYRLVSRPTRAGAIVTAFLVGTLIQVHLLSFTRFAAIALVYGLFALIIRPNRLRIILMASLAAVAAFVIGLPYSVRYLNIYVGFSFQNQEVVEAHGAHFPTISYPRDFIDRFGFRFFIIALIAFGLWLALVRITDLATHTWVWLTTWIFVTVALTLTGILVSPERDLRTLCIPIALVIGWTINALIEGFSRRTTPLATVSILTAGTLLTAPWLAQRALVVGSISIYSTPQELAFLRSLDLRNRAGRVGTDESGVFLAALDDADPLEMDGGPAGFQWYGEPLRTEMSNLFNVLQQHCPAGGDKVLRDMDVRWIYLGPRPSHWTLPGYKFVPGSALEQCSYLQLVQRDPAIDAWFYEVK